MTDTRVDFGILAGAGAPMRHFKAGDVIFNQGDAAEELYVIKSGTVEIRLGNRVLDTLPELSIFGEMALIDRSPRSATAIATTDATLVPVGEKQFPPGEPHTALRAQPDARPGAPAAHHQQRDLTPAHDREESRPPA
jgi:CRP/FNR family transcriptional regulator, cyclic AMP receptor protein